MADLKHAELDHAICRFLVDRDGSPTNSDHLCDMAAQVTSGWGWRLIDRRMQAMRKAGRIKFVGRSVHATDRPRHGWIVVPQEEP